MPDSFRTGKAAFSYESSAPAMRSAPLRKKSFRFHRRSYSCQSCSARDTIFTYKTWAGPYVARIVRVSPPELAREFPGPHASSNVTFAPLCTRWSAVQPPNAPAPTTMTDGVDELENFGEPT